MDNTSVHHHMFDDPESDAQFLGITVDELLHGGRPFEGEQPLWKIDLLGGDMLLDVE